jgi:hypothetical protein
MAATYLHLVARFGDIMCRFSSAAGFCALATLFASAGCARETPPQESDVRTAIETHLRNDGLSSARALADKACSSAFTPEAFAGSGLSAIRLSGPARSGSDTHS